MKVEAEDDFGNEITAEEKNGLLTLVSKDVTNLLNMIHARNDLIIKKFEECKRNENIVDMKGNEGRELNDGSGSGKKRVLALNRWLITDGIFRIYFQILSKNICLCLCQYICCVHERLNKLLLIINQMKRNILELLNNLSEQIPWRNMHVTRMNYPFL